MRRSSFLDALSPHNPVTGKKIIIRPKKLADASTDYSWRTDAELCRLDATQPLNSSFEEYLRWYQGELRYITQGCHFAIETLHEIHIGNCSFFNIDEVKRESEMGIMIGDKQYWGQGYGADTITTSLTYAFSHSPVMTVHLKTLNWNYRAQACFEKCGFTYTGTLVSGNYHFFTMSISRSAILNTSLP